MPQAATPHHHIRRSLSLRRRLFISKINFCYSFYKFSASFYKKQKRFYKTFDSFYKISNIVYNVWNFATQPIMHIKMLLQFNFSLRLGRKVRSTENRVIGYFYNYYKEMLKNNLTSPVPLCKRIDFIF